LPVRKSFIVDAYFQENPETKSIIDNYLPLGKTTATHAAQIFPKLNEIEGEGVMQTLIQNLLEGKEVDASVKEAVSRVNSIMEE
jgi:multiple sugar transport system substrate-binding protein